MKRINFFITTKKVLMVLMCICSFLLLSSCSKLIDDLYTCKEGYLKCSDSKGCCPESTPYYDGHGTCWEILSSCRETGYPCSKCW